MQLVASGPDIPDALVQAHEEGRVVFFCGAGISYLAGLPGFKGLVDAIYRLVGPTQRPAADPEKQPLERTGVPARSAARAPRRERAKSAGAHQR